VTSSNGPERPRPSIFDRLAEPIADRAREKLSQAEDRVREAIQGEIDNVGASIRRRAIQVRPSAIAFGAAALLTFFGLALFVTAAVLGLGHAVPLWASALIIGAALVLLGAGLAAWGRRHLPQGVVGIAAVPVAPPVHPAGEQVHPWAD
jgi:VIT1/CCC1 family predicted Fe2+/Mn2+ transporter